MATASSTAAPKLMASPAEPPAAVGPEETMTPHSTTVSTSRADMEILLIHPRLVTPTKIQRRISPPITRHQSQCPAEKMPPTARAPS